MGDGGVGAVGAPTAGLPVPGQTLRTFLTFSDLAAAGLRASDASGAGVKYLSYWLDLVSRLRSWLTSIEIAAPVRLKRVAISVFVAISRSLPF